jgi:hypothetical protein
MSEDRWYENYDWSVLFPNQWEEDGQEWYCDDWDSCWYFDENLQESCDREGNCYAPEEALEIYFNQYMKLPESEWIDNFINQGGLYNHMPFEHYDENERLWHCDSPDTEEDRWCQYHNEETNEMCDNDEWCQDYDEFVYETLHWFADWEENEWTAWDQTGVTNWGTNLGWCVSDLDVNVGYYESADQCWENCRNIFGDVLYAVDFWFYEPWGLGDCYCQQDCFCRSDIGDDTSTLMTIDSLAELP